MKKILLGFFIAIVIVGGVIGYHFTDSSIQSRAKDIALNSDACLFFMRSSEYGERNIIYCSYNNSLRVIKGSTFAITSTPVITDETLKGLGEVVVFETFKMKNIESNNIKLYQYGNLFELKNVNMYDIPAYSIAVKRTVAGATY
ncbi:hypothetical protein [Pseudoalteromonas tetraodonis]|uniref:hypothetical protein n=1 Tax=Pseudoalteromonas tetraodonis TaxID=43659 RepID=UPI000849C8FF|nr:hypothetical protein [Pseudoalteromonas tetraodonis]ODS13954.1 hypothetical protein BCD66_08390 [Pseudoalteromonas tetraodonis]